MIPHIRLKKGKTEYLLIRDNRSFHIIDGDENLTEDKRKRILETCPDPAGMQAMGLSGMTIAISDLEGVVVHGCSVDSELVFHLEKMKLCYQLARRYEQRYMDNFFRGIPRAATPARRKVKGGNHKDWRMNEQDPAMRRTMNWVKNTLDWTSVVLMIGLLIAMLKSRTWYDLLSVSAIVWTGAAVYLGVVHQEYFTFLDDKEYKKAGGKARVFHLWLPFGPLTMVFLRSMRQFQFFDDLAPLGIALIAGIITGLLVVFFTEDLRRNIGHGFLAVFVAVFLCVGIVMQGNHLLAREAFSYEQGTIMQMYIHSGGRRSRDHYNCVILLPDGRELTVDVGSQAEYDKYQVGGTLTIPIRTGAFGMEYGIYGYGK